MPVRKIPKNHLFVTGGFSSRKAGEFAAFESLLEKEHLLLLDFDDTAEKVEVQPVRIPVKGVRQGYVPDVLIHFRPDPQSGLARKPLLVEVKSSDDLKRHGQKYKPKFAAAREYARNRGWEFEIRDEAQIRTHRLANLKFLREYRNVVPSTDDVQRVLDFVGRGETSSLSILKGIASSDEARLHWLPVIWSMLVSGHLYTDLDRPFTNDVPLKSRRSAK